MFFCKLVLFIVIWYIFPCFVWFGGDFYLQFGHNFRQDPILRPRDGSLVQIYNTPTGALPLFVVVYAAIVGSNLRRFLK
jgi:hypothetical protein